MIKMNNIEIDKLENNTMEIEGNVEINLSNNESDNINFILKDNSKLYIKDISENVDNKTYNFILNNDSYLEINKLYKVNNLNEIVNIDLNGINSEVKYNFSTILDANQMYILNIKHNNKNTKSNVINRGIVLNNSILNIKINATVKKGCINSILNQDSKIVTLGENNSIIEPNLYIDEYLVEARHGATIGGFNKDQLFYLKSRGITDELCNKLLTRGFLLNNLKIENKDDIEI